VAWSWDMENIQKKNKRFKLGDSCLPFNVVSCSQIQSRSELRSNIALLKAGWCRWHRQWFYMSQSSRRCWRIAENWIYHHRRENVNFTERQWWMEFQICLTELDWNLFIYMTSLWSRSQSYYSCSFWMLEPVIFGCSFSLSLTSNVLKSMSGE
jgi:hypothetical protein